MRHDNLPRSIAVHPNIGETVVVFIHLTLLHALFVICTRDNGSVANLSDGIFEKFVLNIGALMKSVF